MQLTSFVVPKLLQVHFPLEAELVVVDLGEVGKLRKFNGPLEMAFDLWVEMLVIDRVEPPAI